MSVYLPYGDPACSQYPKALAQQLGCRQQCHTHKTFLSFLVSRKRFFCCAGPFYNLPSPSGVRITPELLSDTVLCSGQTSVSQLGRRCSDVSALSLPVYFDGIYAIAKVKGVILRFFFFCLFS